MKTPSIIEPILRDNLNTLAAIYAAAKTRTINKKTQALSTRTVARRFANDDRFFERINDGASFTVAMYDRLVARLAFYWPPGAEWPPTIHKPTRKDIEQVLGEEIE